MAVGAYQTISFFIYSRLDVFLFWRNFPQLLTPVTCFLSLLFSMPRFRDRSCGFRSVCFIAVGVGYCGDLQLSVPTIRRCLPAKLVFSKKLYNLMIRVSMIR